MGKYRIEITEGKAEPTIISNNSIEINDKRLVDYWNESIKEYSSETDLLQSRKTRDYLVDIIMVEAKSIQSLFNQEPYNPIIIILSEIYGVTEESLKCLKYEKEIISIIRSCQSYFKEALDACIVENPNDDRFTKIKKLSAKDRYFYCKENNYPFIKPLANTVVKCNIRIENNYNSKQYDKDIIYAYYPESLFEVCYILFMNMVANDLSIKVCKNCHRYFVKNKNYNNEYCSRLISGTNSTCKDVGAMRQYRKKTNNLKKIYDREYKRHYAQYRRKNIDFNEYDNWLTKAKTLREKARKNNISDSEVLNEMFKKISLKIPRKRRYSDF